MKLSTALIAFAIGVGAASASARSKCDSKCCIKTDGAYRISGDVAHKDGYVVVKHGTAELKSKSGKCIASVKFDQGACEATVNDYEQRKRLFGFSDTIHASGDQHYVKGRGVFGFKDEVQEDGWSHGSSWWGGREQYYSGGGSSRVRSYLNKQQWGDDDGQRYGNGRYIRSGSESGIRLKEQDAGFDTYRGDSEYDRKRHNWNKTDYGYDGADVKGGQDDRLSASYNYGSASGSAKRKQGEAYVAQGHLYGDSHDGIEGGAGGIATKQVDSGKAHLQYEKGSGSLNAWNNNRYDGRYDDNGERVAGEGSWNKGYNTHQSKEGGSVDANYSKERQDSLQGSFDRDGYQGDYDANGHADGEVSATRYKQDRGSHASDTGDVAVGRNTKAYHREQNYGEYEKSEQESASVGTHQEGSVHKELSNEAK